MRVSERQRYGLGEKRVEVAKSENARVLDELSTQKAIREISDNPIGHTRAVRYKDRIGGMEQQLKNIEYARGFMSKTEATLVDITDSLIRAKELAIGMADDTYDANSREVTSCEVNEILKGLVQLGNSQYNGRFIFGGFRTTSPPISADGDSLGDDGAIFLQVADDDFRQVNLQSRTLFEATLEEREKGHFNMIHAVDVLYEGLRTNDKFQIQRALSEIDFQLEKTTGFHASLGGLTKSLEQTQQRNEKEIVFSKQGLSAIEDSDAFKATSEFKRTETVLQSTLLATNKMLQPSLLDFMQ